MHATAKRKLMLIRLAIQFSIAILLSFVITLVNYGLSGPFFVNWAKGFVVAFLIIPVAMRLIPHIGARVRAALGPDASVTLIRSVVAIAVAITMEIIIALAITLAQRGFEPGWTLIWGTSFLKALPMGLCIGFTMTFLVQPRMQKLAAAQ